MCVAKADIIISREQIGDGVIDYFHSGLESLHIEQGPIQAGMQVDPKNVSLDGTGGRKTCSTSREP